MQNMFAYIVISYLTLPCRACSEELLYLGNNNDILLGHFFKCTLCMNNICIQVIKYLNFNIL